MTLYDYLLGKYGFNEPILTTEIRYKDYSKVWLYKEINRLVKDGKLMKFDKGIYYIPKDTPFGKSILNPNKVIEKKYINDGSDVIGYYSGVSFLNMIGMSSQVANRIEIYTNKETSKFREVSVGRRRVILRRARVNITGKNAPVLSLLEMMNFVSPDFFGDEEKKLVAEYVERNNIAKCDITKYAPFFPDKALKTFVESEVVYTESFLV